MNSIKSNVTNSFNNNQDQNEKLFIASEELCKLAEKKTGLNIIAATLYNISFALEKMETSFKSDYINERRLRAKLKALSYEVEDLGNIFELASIQDNE